MTKRRDKQTIAVFFGLVLSTGVLAGAVEDRTVNHQVRHTGQLEQDNVLAGSTPLDDRVVSAESRHLLKVRDGGGADRGRGSYRGRGKGHGGRDYAYRHPGRHGYKGRRYYGYGRPYRHHHDHYYGGAEPLLWYGLGVLTPYLLDDRFYY